MSIFLTSSITNLVLDSLKFPGHGEEHILWRANEAYRKHRNQVIAAAIWLVLIVLFYGIAGAFFPKFVPSIRALPEGQVIFMSVVSSVLGIAPLIAAYVGFIDARTQFIEQVRAGLLETFAKNQKELKFDSSGKPVFSSLWELTQERINLYHTIATRQSETSFRVGIGATIAGFIAVLGLGVVAAFSKGGTAAIAASVVGVAGAAMTGYIGSTFMKAQSEASTQLQQFFLQPVEFFKLLGLERLLDRMPPEERATAIQRIIDSTMPATTLTPPPIKRTPRKKTLLQRVRAALGPAPAVLPPSAVSADAASTDASRHTPSP